MPRPDNYPRNLGAKLKKLDKLARATAELSVEIFGDLVSMGSIPVPPKPKKPAKVMLMATSIPVPPKPKFETLALIADGALTIGQGLEDLAADQVEASEQ
jgi:hypothetical protein